ncbi:CCHC-type zinc finger nucleic acid binding protein-like [Palaemon carinicauda]|uniref:CCHC-type zinc finger nucleic acid binding protein-like n=1 Tax=Palaemon carinicauda TaxID=392227 RepID=UPI0035B66033
MGGGAVGGVSSASGKGLIVEEKAKVRDNGGGSDSEIEDKGIRHSKNEQKCDRKNEKKGHKKNECRWVLGACFECGEIGHRISECKNEKLVKRYRCGMIGDIASGCRSDRTNVIFGNYGKDGHYARMCKEHRTKCTECGVDGHITKVCAVGGVSSASGKGLIVEEKAKVRDNGGGSDSEIEDKGIRHSKNEQKCDRKNEKKGHKKNECRWVLGACFECGEIGHRISECKNEKLVKRYRCGMIGDIASGCRSDRTNVIFGNYGKDGHYARMCKEHRTKCTECGVDGHITKVCKKKELGQPGCSGN